MQGAWVEADHVLLSTPGRDGFVCLMLVASMGDLTWPSRPTSWTKRRRASQAAEEAVNALYMACITVHPGLVVLLL